MRLLMLSGIQSLMLCLGQVTLKFALQRMGNFSFSMAYPMISLSYVFGMLAAIYVFHEQVPLVRWAGVLLIMTGCVLIAK